MTSNDKHILIIHSIIFVLSSVCVFFINVAFFGIMGCNVGFILGTLSKKRHYSHTRKIYSFCIAILAFVLTLLLYKYSLLWVVIINLIAFFIVIYLLLKSKNSLKPQWVINKLRNCLNFIGNKCYEEVFKSRKNNIIIWISVRWLNRISYLCDYQSQ